MAAANDFLMYFSIASVLGLNKLSVQVHAGPKSLKNKKQRLSQYGELKKPLGFYSQLLGRAARGNNSIE